MDTVQTASLADAARAALEEHEAAQAAAQARATVERTDRAHDAIRHAIGRIIGATLHPDNGQADPATKVRAGTDYEIAELDIDGRDGQFRARVTAGDLTLMVERRGGLSPESVSLLATCADCGNEREHGSHITSLTELGVYLRQAEQPCRACQGDSLMVEQPSPRWQIERHSTAENAAAYAEDLERGGYEVRLMYGDGDIVVSGHRFQ